MKKMLTCTACAALSLTLASCGGNAGKAKTAEGDAAETKAAVPEYTVVNNATVDLATFPQDKDGYYVIFHGKTFNGWLGDGKENVPTR